MHQSYVELVRVVHHAPIIRCFPVPRSSNRGHTRILVTDDTLIHARIIPFRTKHCVQRLFLGVG